jgi:hypothetical protein
MRTILLPLALGTLLGGCAAPDPGPEPTAAPSSAAASLDPNRPLPSPLPEIAARVNGEPIPLHRILPMARNELRAMPEDEQEQRRPEAVRRALEQYVDRELLFQEAISRNVVVDQRAVDWAYDRARSTVPDEDEWVRSLAEQGMDENSFRTELRVQQTVAALLEQEEVAPLLERLRARARIETFL